jgi:hypothetical protein
VRVQFLAGDFGSCSKACFMKRTSGIAKVQWQTPDWNESAIQFYRALGAADAAKVRFALWLS